MYPGTFVEASKKHLPDTPLKCNYRERIKPLMDFYEEQIESQTVYNGIVVDIRRDTARLQNGSIVPREIVVHSGGVGIVPLTEDNKVLMVRQYRYPMEEELLEIPAGKLDAGEEPLHCAIRELSEETGCTAGRMIDLGAIYPSPGFCKETLFLYLATDLQYGSMHLDDDELLSIEAVGVNDLMDMIMANKLPDAKTIIGIMKTKKYLEAL